MYSAVFKCYFFFLKLVMLQFLNIFFPSLKLGTFDEAKKNEKKFENTSNVETTDDENLGKGKRRLKSNLPSQSNSSDDEDIIKESQSLLQFPPVPTKKKTISVEQSPTCSFTISPEVVNSAPREYEVVAEGACVSSVCIVFLVIDSFCSVKCNFWHRS